MQIHKRNCDYPKAGKIYAVIPSSSKPGEEKKFAGRPVTSYAIDPTLVIPEGWLSCQGMKLAPQMKDGQQVINPDGKEVWDMWDWIGEQQYPNPMDWFMEISELGFHQLVQSTLSFDLLTPESKYYAVHPRANIVPANTLYQTLPDELGPCPRQDPEHQKGSNCYATCFRLLNDDLIGVSAKPGERCTRQMASFSYGGWSSTIPQEKANYQPAAFVRLPLGRIAQYWVYKDDTNIHEHALNVLRQLDMKLQKIRLIEL